MLEPSLALQAAVRATLIGNSTVTALVPADRIRAGSTRPDVFPTIILAGSQTQFLGRAAAGQFMARVFLDLNIWAVEDGPDTARAIGFAALNALIEPPEAAAMVQGFNVDEWEAPRLLWMRDPQPERAYSHGVMSLEAVIRWRA